MRMMSSQHASEMKSQSTDQEMNVATVEVVLGVPLNLLDSGLW